jgi:hypothetical protein
MKKTIIYAALIMMACLAPLSAHAQATPTHSRGQVIMLPVHDNVLIGPKKRALTLSGSFLAINPNPDKPLQLTSIVLYDQQGDLLQTLLAAPQELAPLANLRYEVPKLKVRGALLIEWRAKAPVSPLYLEALYVGAAGQQGISFTTQGQVIKELK